MNIRTNQKISKRLIYFFFWSCAACFLLLGISYVIALRVPLSTPDLSDKVIITKLTFASLGILFGILQVFLGILLALIGVTIDYDIDATVGPTKLKLVSTSPGILLILVGNLLFGFSLMREFEVSQTTGYREPNKPKIVDAQQGKVSAPDELRGKGGVE